MKPDFSHFKREINLTQYAAYLGYEIDRKKTTRSSIAMRLNSSDKIIITRRGGIWLYFSVFDDRDSGTIIDFIANRTSQSLSEIGLELQSWLGDQNDLPDPQHYVRTVDEKKPDPERIKRLFNYCTLATSHSYLERRGITEAILRSARFEGRIFQDRYDNAVFPHFKDGQVCALELKGEHTGLLVRGSEKTLWRSNTCKDDDTLIIAEAPIDAISYQIIHQLSTTFYVATSGGLSPLQSDLIQQLLTNLPALKKVIMIADNDTGGDALTNRFNTLINETDYQGIVTRHSPEIHGQDWNDVLLESLGSPDR